MRRLLLVLTVVLVMATVVVVMAVPAFAKDQNFGGCQSFTAQTGTSLFTGPSTPSEQAAGFNPRESHDFKGACGH